MSEIHTAKNGAQYIKDTSGKVRFISGASKQYLASIRGRKKKTKAKRPKAKGKGLLSSLLGSFGLGAKLKAKRGGAPRFQLGEGARRKAKPKRKATKRGGFGPLATAGIMAGIPVVQQLASGILGKIFGNGVNFKTTRGGAMTINEKGKALIKRELQPYPIEVRKATQQILKEALKNA